MLSVERVKELLNDPKLSDKEIEEIRDQTYLLTEVIFEQWMEDRKKSVRKRKKRVKKINHYEIFTREPRKIKENIQGRF